MEWKSLANAIIHDGYNPDPNLNVTIIGCEKCGNPLLYNLISNEFPLIKSPDSRVSLHVYECPVCGHRELDCFGVYGLPDHHPNTIMPFICHFFDLWFNMLNFAHMREREESCIGFKNSSLNRLTLKIKYWVWKMTTSLDQTSMEE